MKTEEKQRAEFDAWHDALYVSYTQYPHPYEAWQARQPEIDALEAEIARLREALRTLWDAKCIKENNDPDYPAHKQRAWELVR